MARGARPVCPRRAPGGRAGPPARPTRGPATRPGPGVDLGAHRRMKIQRQKRAVVGEQS
eukprot:COSAG04_NODE_1776_length_5602_cov_25.720880_3_plen_58_part_01